MMGHLDNLIVIQVQGLNKSLEILSMWVLWIYDGRGVGEHLEILFKEEQFPGLTDWIGTHLREYLNVLSCLYLRRGEVDRVLFGLLGLLCPVVMLLLMLIILLHSFEGRSRGKRILERRLNRFLSMY
jgi:hypothetical protein